MQTSLLIFGLHDLLFAIDNLIHNNIHQEVLPEF